MHYDVFQTSYNRCHFLINPCHTYVSAKKYLLKVTCRCWRLCEWDRMVKTFQRVMQQWWSLGVFLQHDTRTNAIYSGYAVVPASIWPLRSTGTKLEWAPTGIRWLANDYTIQRWACRYHMLSWGPRMFERALFTGHYMLSQVPVAHLQRMQT